MRYGLLDFVWVDRGVSPSARVLDTVRLMAHADALGFERYWVGEHHLPGYASASPEVLISAGLQRTQRIRLGAGAVLLGYRDALRVALDYRTLSALSDRVDLGIGRGRADRQGNHDLLAGRTPSWGDGLMPAEPYREQAIQMAALLREGMPGVTVQPDDAAVPQLWVCGSGHAASLAAEIGAAFCYTLFHPGQKSPDVIQRYRDEFQTRHPKLSPLAAIAIAGSVTEDEEQATHVRAAHRYIAYWPDIVGPAQMASDRLHEFAARYQPDDILWMDIEVDTERRLKAMERLANIMELESITG
jgi:luciferase family oxidoreductase group 1